ncbi:TIM barrel protein [Candidatus Poribacteria bacterium]|nr:TIM barrel protein [Candidatus Poribacteria bacterium]
MRLGYSRPGSVEQLQEMISKAIEQGYEGLQLKGSQYSDWLSNADAFKEKFDISGIMGIIVYGSDEEILQQSINFAGDLKLPEVTWVPSWRRDQLSASTYEPAANTLNRMGRYAISRLTRLSVHNHVGQLFQDEYDLYEFRRFVDFNRAGLTLDTAHLALAGVEDIPAVIRDSADYVYLFHIKDLDGESFCPLGEGELDFDAIFKAIDYIGFDGWLVVDDETDQMNLDEALPHAVDFISSYIDL